MASFLELRGLFGSGDLRNRIEVATIIAANAIAQNSTAESDERLFWAQRVFASPGRETDRAMLVAIAQNSTKTVAQITGAPDAAIQSAVDSAVGVLVVGSTLVGGGI